MRCLPLDFPEWEAARDGATQAEFYATVIIEGFNPNVPVIFDTNGVPVWWTERVGTFSNEPLPNGNLAYAAAMRRAHRAPARRYAGACPRPRGHRATSTTSRSCPMATT